MKVRMIFAHEFTPEDEKEPRLLKVDEKPDLDEALANELIAAGIAEPVTPLKVETKGEKK